MKSKIKRRSITVLGIVVVAALLIIIGISLKGINYFIPPFPYVKSYVTLNSFFEHCDDYKNKIEGISKKYGYYISSYVKNNIEENKKKGVDGSDNNMSWLIVTNNENDNDYIDITFSWSSTEEDVSYSFKYSDKNSNRLEMMKEILKETFGYKFNEDEISEFISSDLDIKYLNWRKDYYIEKADGNIEINGKTIKGKIF